MGCVYRRFLIKKPNRKAGERPARSRHCKMERLRVYATGHVPGRFGDARKSSQENCLFSDHHLTCEGWGGDRKTGRVPFALFAEGFFVCGG